jgi:diguanylate cyclase (GGDEF)-like protein/PAS domain S-box-containing protein
MTGKRLAPGDAGQLEQVRVVLFLPLYQGGTRPARSAERRASLQGWVMAPVRIGSLMASLYGQRARLDQVRIHDGINLADETLLFDYTQAGSQNSGAEQAEYLVLAGQTWAVSARSGGSAATPSGKDSSLVIALVGGGMTLLMAVLAWMLVTRRDRALALATEMTAELREVSDRLALILDTSPDAVVLNRWKDGIVTDVNLRFTTLTQFERDDLVGRHVTDIGLWADPQALQAYIRSVQTQGVCENFESEFRLKDGSLNVCLVSGKKFLIRGVPHLLSIARDISERKQIELRMEHMAQHDPLTALPNRALFFDRLKQEMGHARRDGTRLALMFIDLDRFKEVNDTHGHAVGDLLLQEVARRIGACLRQSDTVGRIGGDEFVVLLPLIKDDSDALGVALKIRQALDQTFELGQGISLHISCSNGIATFPEHGANELELSKNADAAMYLAKQDGGNRVGIYSPAP